MVEMLLRGWRVFATGLCFAAFGLGGLMLRLLVFPALDLAVRNKSRRQRAAKAVIHLSFRMFIALMRGLGVLSYELRGLHKLDRSGLLVLANHPSLIDVVFLMALVPRADCIVKASLARNPFTRGPVYAAGFVTNDAGPAMVDSCVASLRGGNSLIIFPEGTRSSPHEPIKLQRGAANIAVRGEVDVTPVVIRCVPPTLTKGVPWWRVPQSRPHFVIEVGDDLSVAGFLTEQAPPALAARRLTDYLTIYFTQEIRRGDRCANA